jgi:hypothetical protein
LLIKTEYYFPIEELQKQVSQLPEFNKSLALNETDGDLLSGQYKTKSEYINTPLGDVLSSLGDIGEARLLKLKNEDVYTAHCDPDDRWHLTITTTPYSYLANLQDNTLHHLPADGHVWLMDTSIVHSAFNLGGGLERIHLNIRQRLPSYKGNGWRMKVSGSYDWKQRLYVGVLGYINKAIKVGHVTGIRRISDNEILLNVSDEMMIKVIKKLCTQAGLETVIEHDTN